MSVSNGKLPVGERLLPALLDEYAHYDPDKLVAVVPADAGMKMWNKVNYRELKQVVDHLAWDIEKKIGRSDTFEHLVYLGVSDIRYMCFWLAAMKCGYCNLVLSPRNSPEEQRSLLEDTGCKVLFYSSELKKTVEGIKNILAWELKSFLLPTYEDLIGAATAIDAKPYPFIKTFQQLAHKPAITFHTSGTTGMPKPITVVHFYFATMDNLSILPVPKGRKQSNWTVLNSGDVYFNGFPPFHPAGASFACITPLHTGTVFVLPPSEVPLNEDVFLKAAKQFDFECAFLPPSFIEDIAGSPEALEAISKLKYVFSMAGPLGLASGDKVSQYTQLIQLIGSTECGLMAGLVPKNWRGFEWNPNYGDEMQQVEGTESYERVVTKNPKFAKYHAIWSTFPDITEWRTRDLFVRDAEDPNFWTFVGRTDDVIVLSNGEKVQPVALQTRIQDHPLLKSAVVVGQGQFQVGLIIEPDYDKYDASMPDQELIDKVWPAVETACKSVTATGRIFRDMIMVAKKDKPFPRAGKGTILRAKTLALYKEEIEELYAKSKDVEAAARPLPNTINESTVKKFVRDTVTGFLGIEDLSDDDHLFLRGMDSLQTLGIVKTLRMMIETAPNAEVKTGKPLVAPKMIYQNPSISKITNCLLEVLQGAVPGITQSDAQSGRRREANILAMVQRHTNSIPNTKRAPTSGRKEGIHVLITGTTGFLGPYLLHSVASDARVSKVYCLNRSADSQGRAEQSLEKLKLIPVSSKLEFMTVQFGDKQFGLDDVKYQELLQNVDLIFHNAWAVNFNYELETFEHPFIKTVSDLKNLSHHSTHGAHIFFISSIGTVGSWEPSPDKNPEDKVLVPESIMYNSAACISTGYAESKHVSERILAVAAHEAGVPVTIARLGQIAGPTTAQGKWNDAEWLPRIIKTSKTISKIPQTLGTMVGDGIDWIPVDLMAAACVELGLKRLQTQGEKVIDTFHLENPQLSQWSDLIPVIQDSFKADVIPYVEWLTAIQQHAGKSTSDNPDLPVLSMMDYYQAAEQSPQRVRPSTSNAQAQSKVIANLDAIGAASMATWLQHWAY